MPTSRLDELRLARHGCTASRAPAARSSARAGAGAPASPSPVRETSRPAHDESGRALRMPTCSAKKAHAVDTAIAAVGVHLVERRRAVQIADQRERRDRDAERREPVRDLADAARLRRRAGRARHRRARSSRRSWSPSGRSADTAAAPACRGRAARRSPTFHPSTRSASVTSADHQHEQREPARHQPQRARLASRPRAAATATRRRATNVAAVIGSMWTLPTNSRIASTSNVQPASTTRRCDRRERARGGESRGRDARVARSGPHLTSRHAHASAPSSPMGLRRTASRAALR